MELKGKTVVVVGGSSGIGLSTSKILLSEGVKNLAILDINENLNLIQELQETFKLSKIKFYFADVRNKNRIEECFQKIITTFDANIEIVIVSSGILNEKLETYAIDVNLIGAINVNLVAISFMKKTNTKGTIVNVSSIAGHLPCYNYPFYTASKYGLVGFTQSLTNNLIENEIGVKFILICPWGTETPLLKDTNTKGFISKIKWEDIQDNPKRFIKQTPDECAKCLINALKLNKNGSIWEIFGGNMTEIKFLGSC